MPKLVWAVFCQQAIVDQMTNNISVINQLDMLNPARPPQLPKNATKGTGKKKAGVLAGFTCSVVSVWEREKPTLSESSELRIDLLGPKRQQLGRFSAPLDLRKHRRVRQLGNMPGIPLVGEGTYRFVFRCRYGVKWRRAGEVTFEVNYSDPRRIH
jgi:hypothetical protein